ncbi:MAG: YbaB/EbfC family nucleoid-associated protein [Planctomycetia bacterium]|nr:YbaB/EbfC family nucleoid-associated protein [Planctomycetia bacterium]
MFKGLANLGSILKQAQQMGSRMHEVNDRLKSVRVTGSAGGGLVEVELNGLGEVLRLTLDPSLVEKQDRELIEDLVPAAVNQGIAKAREQHAAMVREMTEGMELPGLQDALKSMGVDGAGPA